MKQTPSALTQLVRLAWPMYIAQIAAMASGTIDTVMAGRLSTLDLASAGIAASILVTITMSLSAVLMALPPLVAKLQGAGQQAAVGREIHQALWIALALSVLAMAALHFPGPFITLSQLQPAVEYKVRAYLGTSAWGVPAMLLLRVYIGLCQGISQPRAAMRFSLLALALKAPLNALFMYGQWGLPAMGAQGCALASVVDNWLIAVLAGYWCLRQPSLAPLELRQRIRPPEWAAIREFLALGIPIALAFIADMTAFTFMALFIARLGPVMSGAHQIASNLTVFAYMFPMSLGSASAVLVAQAMGAGQPQFARHVSGLGIKLGLGVAIVIAAVLWLLAPQIAALYTHDTLVRTAAVPLILLVGAYHLGDALQAVAVNTLRGYQRTTIPMIIYTIGLWGVGLGGGVLLGLTNALGPARGAAGFWEAAALSLVLVGGIMGVYLNRVSRVEIVLAPQG